MDCLQTTLNIITTLATICAVCVAIFGDVIKQFFVGPRLRVKIPVPMGQVVLLKNEDKRAYYHLEVINPKKLQAKNVIVLLNRIEEEWQGGKRVLWNGEVPLRWIYTEAYQKLWWDILDSHKCDLITIGEDGLSIMTLFKPTDFKGTWRDACSLFLTVVAKSDETVSKPMVVHIIWDGRFQDNIEEMRDHLKIELEEFKAINQKVSE